MRYTAAVCILTAMLAGSAWADNGPGSGEFTDGNGFYWFITNDGSIGWGTNKVYNGALLPHVGQIRWDTDPAGGLIRPVKTPVGSGREYELGPWKQGALQVSRRILVSETEPWCRVVDTYENTTDNDLPLSLNYVADLRYPVAVLQSASGTPTVGPNDGSFLSKDAEGSPNPATCHIFAFGPGALRPAVKTRMGDNRFWYSFSLGLPARQKTALCFFESQQTAVPEAADFLRRFDARLATRDLPPELRRLIRNMRLGLDPLADLPQSTEMDLVVTDANQLVLGSVAKRSFAFTSSVGQFTLDANLVVGMLRDDMDPNRTWLILPGGQYLCGRAEGELEFTATDSNTLRMPLSAVKSWSYRTGPEQLPKIGGNAELAEVRLTDGGLLRGKLGDGFVNLQGDGPDANAAVPLANLYGLRANGDKGDFIIRCWGRKPAGGRLAQDSLAIQVAPGLTLRVPATAISSAQQLLPPQELAKRVADLAAKLGDDDYRTRESATEELVAIGADVIPLLAKLRQTPDMEIQARIEAILTRLGARGDDATAPQGRR